MKLFTLILFLLCYPILPTSELENDHAFVDFKTKLDSGWKVYVKKNLLQIERKEPVFVMPENRTNAPPTLGEPESYKIVRMKKQNYWKE